VSLPPRLLAGECLCRSIRYEVDDAFGYALNCHCSQCRRATGSTFKPLAGIAAERLRITTGHDDLMTFGQGVDHDVRCRRCGSFLCSLAREGAFVHVALGTLIDEPSIRPSAHIYVGSKAAWVTITDDLPQHHEL
jgi:hypothetical protein